VDRIDLAVKKFKKKPKQFIIEDEEQEHVSCNCQWFESCPECRKTAVN
jgi:hypothetical protein